MQARCTGFHVAARAAGANACLVLGLCTHVHIPSHAVSGLQTLYTLPTPPTPPCSVATATWSGQTPSQPCTCSLVLLLRPGCRRCPARRACRHAWSPTAVSGPTRTLLQVRADSACRPPPSSRKGCRSPRSGTSGAPPPARASMLTCCFTWSGVSAHVTRSWGPAP